MLCWYVICLFILCGIILCFRQGSKVEQFHWLVIPCINIFEIKNKIWLDHRFKHGGCKASVKCQVRNILFVASQTVFTSLDIWVKSTNNAWSNKCVWPPCNKLFYLSFYLIVHINSLGPSDAKWRQGSRSTLVQVMACCLTAPSHYLNQCWLIITEVLWHSY